MEERRDSIQPTGIRACLTSDTERSRPPRTVAQGFNSSASRLKVLESQSRNSTCGAGSSMATLPIGKKCPELRRPDKHGRMRFRPSSGVSDHHLKKMLIIRRSRGFTGRSPSLRGFPAPQARQRQPVTPVEHPSIPETFTNPGLIAAQPLTWAWSREVQHLPTLADDTQTNHISTTTKTAYKHHHKNSVRKALVSKYGLRVQVLTVQLALQADSTWPPLARN